MRENEVHDVGPAGGLARLPLIGAGADEYCRPGRSKRSKRR
jgi:hypothetical protein